MEREEEDREECERTRLMRRAKRDGHRMEQRCDAEAHLSAGGEQQQIGGHPQLWRQWQPLRMEPDGRDARERAEREAAVVELHRWYRFEEVAVAGGETKVALWNQPALHEREGVVSETRLHAGNEGAGDGGDPHQE